MKQVVQNFKTGAVTVEEVPAPAVRPGCVLVRNVASLISAGTEGGTVQLGKKSLLGKARARPEQVKKVLQAIRTEGVLGTVGAVNRTLDLPIPLGYSCSGVVDEVGEGVTDLAKGDRVACGGAGMAYHAGVVVVPRNLCVPLPDAVSHEQAAFTTVGSIAMQSARIADLKLGESAVVIGLGLVGLLTGAILSAAGCRVIGIDVDPRRVQWVRDRDLYDTFERSTDTLMDQVLTRTGGFGADAVIVTAGVNSNDPVSLGGELARYKGRVVVVGRTVMEAPRDTYLFKELELCTSLAYGPGTGDASYEQEGYDYPIGYVRWTENRNMQCFLDLVARGRVDLSMLCTHTFPVEQADEAFDVVTDPQQACIGVVLTYGEGVAHTGRVVRRRPDERAQRSRRSAASGAEKLRVGVIGTGSFATNIMLPLLAARKDVEIAGLVSATGTRAAALAAKYDVPLVSSDAKELIDADDIDCLFVFTRHGTHASYAEQGLRQGKHVFVEKPLAMTLEQIEAVNRAQQESGGALMVGFNRRWSPLAQKMKRFFDGRCQPMIVTFRGNVGYRPPEHWLHDPKQGGGVILGEGCHFIDFCRWLVDAPLVSVRAESVGPSDARLVPEDNVRVDLRFQDGSLATVVYVSNGAPGLGREQCEAHADGKSAVWRDFKYLSLTHGLSLSKVSRKLVPDKGFKAELAAFLDQAREHEFRSVTLPWLESQFDSSHASIQAARNVVVPSVAHPVIA
jgi:predicted dehydrogenase/threonine dehydrogenase-like Zn-dependent dehydrogenase